MFKKNICVSLCAFLHFHRRSANDFGSNSILILSFYAISGSFFSLSPFPISKAIPKKSKFYSLLNFLGKFFCIYISCLMRWQFPLWFHRELDFRSEIYGFLLLISRFFFCLSLCPCSSLHNWLLCATVWLLGKWEKWVFNWGLWSLYFVTWIWKMGKQSSALQLDLYLFC